MSLPNGILILEGYPGAGKTFPPIVIASISISLNFHVIFNAPMQSASLWINGQNLQDRISIRWGYIVPVSEARAFLIYLYIGDLVLSKQVTKLRMPWICSRYCRRFQPYFHPPGRFNPYQCDQGWKYEQILRYPGQVLEALNARWTHSLTWLMIPKTPIMRRRTQIRRKRRTVQRRD